MSEPSEQIRTSLNSAVLLPDLRTLQPTELHVRLHSRGLRLLRFANTVWNSGKRPLELAGEFNRLTQRSRVSQRLYAADGTTVDHFVGEFIWHFLHAHWHFQDFALYQLWSLTPAGERHQVVASSAKLSYCLIDTDVVNAELPGADVRRHYFGCGRRLQGLTVGWGDKYDSFLDGQSLDISGLADGIYALVSTANPWGNLVEADYGNNVSVVYVNIVNDRVAIVPPPELDEAQCHANGRC